MLRLCSDKLQHYHEKVCDDKCERYTNCVSRLTGIDFELNLDTIHIDHSDNSWMDVINNPGRYTRGRLS